MSPVRAEQRSRYPPDKEGRPHREEPARAARKSRAGDAATSSTIPPAGDTVSYAGMHAWLRRRRGRASQHACVDCPQPAAHWSYSHDDPDERSSDQGAYSLKAEHYAPRCVSCHRRHDLAVKARAGQLSLWGRP